MQLSALIKSALIAVGSKMKDSILFVGDSLTEAHQNATYAKQLVKRLAPMYGGMGEFGYLPLSATHTKTLGSNNQVRVSRTSPEAVIHMWGTSDRKWNQSPYKYSPDGQGFYVKATNAETIFIDTKGLLRSTHVRLFYLKQVGGCKFSFGYTDQPAALRVLVDSHSELEEVGIIEIDTRHITERLVIQLDRSTKKFAGFGVQFVDKSTSQGLTYDTFARSGVTLLDHNQLISVEMYYQYLNPTIVMLNIGTNDAIAKLASKEFKVQLQLWLDRLRSVCPTTRVYMIEPNRPEYYGQPDSTRGFLSEEYTQIRKEIVDENSNIHYIDVPALTGDYEYYLENSWMQDNVHPSPIGKGTIATAIFNYILNFEDAVSYSIF